MKIQQEGDVFWPQISGIANGRGRLQKGTVWSSSVLPPFAVQDLG
ncbi:hypothetical protein DBT_0826 [Dissulfuribacter thermophilus]|uniref:Uncharacterized protein n=1 Tax=Dissulfuribacter thermophilus TaxID=1156395 RepID=A0A1B9F804_9BACT|nr:hypothetical protein DBT_0826 [Dissulfuribacter thermophilus]